MPNSQEMESRQDSIQDRRFATIESTHLLLVSKLERFTEAAQERLKPNYQLIMAIIAVMTLVFGAISFVVTLQISNTNARIDEIRLEMREQSRAEQSRAEQSRAEQSRAEQSRAEREYQLRETLQDIKQRRMKDFE